LLLLYCLSWLRMRSLRGAVAEVEVPAVVRAEVVLAAEAQVQAVQPAEAQVQAAQLAAA
jgi:hypothetical protein